MLKDLSSNQARFIALLARTARAQRDSLLGHVAEDDLDGTASSRGQHNPTAELGYDPLSAAAAPLRQLGAAIAELTPSARVELYTLMRIGQGDLAAEKWHHGISEAALLGDAVISAALTEDADLHDHIEKGLFESEAA